MRAAILIIALFASGCVSQQERQARDESSCDRFGFKRGTEAYSNCLMKQDSDWKREQEAWMLRSQMALENAD